MALFDLLAVDNFNLARSIQRSDVSAEALATVRTLDEKAELEPWLQAILHDTNRTPHGPSELVDILTHKVAVRGRTGLAAFILKGKSFPTVRPAHVSHQILRLPRIRDLSFAVLAAPGDILDEVKEQFIAMATQVPAGTIAFWTQTTWLVCLLRSALFVHATGNGQPEAAASAVIRRRHEHRIFCSKKRCENSPPRIS